jgi:hypothetical protein
MSSKKYKIKEIIICDLDKLKNDWHLLDNPRKLPCGRTVCLECYQSFPNNKCTFCQKVHDQSEIVVNQMVEIEMEENKQEIGEFLANELKTRTQNFYNFKDEITKTITEKVFEFIKEDIDLRVESVKCDFEKMKLNLFEKIDRNVSLYPEARLKKAKELKDKIESIRDDNTLGEYEKFTKIEGSVTNFLDKFDLTEQVVRSKEEIEKMLKPELVIGILKYPVLQRFNKSKKIEPKLVELKNLNPYDICLYTVSEYLITSLNKDFIFKLTKTHRSYKLNEISSIGNQILYKPSRICVDFDFEKIYLCIGLDKTNIQRKIIITNLNLDIILDEIDDKKIESLHNPWDIHINNENNLLIMDYASNLIFIYNTKEMALVKKLSITFEMNYIDHRPYSVSLNNNYIAVNINKKSSIQIYEITNDNLILKSCLNLFSNNQDDDDEKYDINGIYLENNEDFEQNENISSLYIYAHLNSIFSDKVVGYKYDELKKDWFLTFEYTIRNNNDDNQDNLNNVLVSKNLRGSWLMKLINDNLIICLWGQEILMI